MTVLRGDVNVVGTKSFRVAPIVLRVLNGLGNQVLAFVVSVAVDLV